MDKHINNYGRLLIDLCTSTKLRIVNGRIGNDCNIGSFTCHTPRGSSVVDYHIVSEDLFNSLVIFVLVPCLSTLTIVHFSLSSVHLKLGALIYPIKLRHWSPSMKVVEFWLVNG